MENISQQKDGDLHLQLIARAIRVTVNRQTGFTPNRMMLGREVIIPVDIMLGRNKTGLKPAEYVTKLEETFQGKSYKKPNCVRKGHTTSNQKHAAMKWVMWYTWWTPLPKQASRKSYRNHG